MIAPLRDATISALRALEVNTNIDVFARHWIQENGLNNLEDMLALFDRINLPYQIHPKSDKIYSQPHKVLLAVNNDHQAEVGRYNTGRYQVYNNKRFEEQALPELSAEGFWLVIKNLPKEKTDPNWVGGRLHAFKPMLPQMMLMTFLINIFSLMIPFITMAIYDHVIGGEAKHELFGIGVGATLLFSMMWFLRGIRSKVLATLSNRLSREVSQAIVHKITHSNYSVIQQTPSSSQFIQTQMAERIGSIFSGPLGSALFDLPFVLIFILAIGLLGGWLVIVPIIALLLYYFFAKRNLSQLAAKNNQSTVAGTNRQNMLHELTSRWAFMKSMNWLPYWQRRFEKANFVASEQSFKHVIYQAKYTSIYYAIGVGSTLAIIGLGIDLIFAQVMSAGGLIASMMLISRVTGPAQMLANSASRLQMMQQSKLQINRSLSQDVEHRFQFHHQPLPTKAPSFNLEQVTLRFPKQAKPALNGVSFAIEPGEVVVISGPMGSGKTSLLEVMAGLQSFQNGVVDLNNVNLNQYDPQLYRHWCFIRAAVPDILLLTIRDWLTDGRDLEDDKILAAIESVGGKFWMDSLPNKLNTPLSAAIQDHIFDVLSGFQAQVLIDAKAFLHPFKLFLLDNPVADHHPLAKQNFMKLIEQKRGEATIVFTTHDAELMKLADKVVILDQGAVVYAGPIDVEQSKESNELSQTITENQNAK